MRASACGTARKLPLFLLTFTRVIPKRFPGYAMALIPFAGISPVYAAALEITSDTPATSWESQALPVGNGRMGAMIYGNPLAERMQFNEISLWTGGANPSGNYDINTFGCYQNFGELLLGEGTVVTWPSAASHQPPSAAQDVSSSADGSTSTKWCFVHNNQPIVWLADHGAPASFTGYQLTSADDVPARDPRSWVLAGSNDGVNWTPLDSRNLSGATTPPWPFAARNQTQAFTIPTTGTFRYHRFTFAPNTATTHFQVAEIRFTSGPGSGTVSWPSAASHNPPSAGQTVASSFDKNAMTKWCFEHNGQTVVWQVDYLQPVAFTRYALTSAEDVPQRDPKEWSFEGSNGGGDWTVLDTRSLDAATTPVWPFPSRRQRVEFTPAATGAFRHYRFVFRPNAGAPHFQVAEIELLGAADTPPTDGVTNARRTLDISDAIHRTTWTRDGVNFTRETFASHPHQVIVTRISADQAGKVSVSLGMAGGHSETITAAGNEIGFSGTLANGLRYATKARVLATGGSLVSSGDRLVAEDCDELLILHAAATDYAMDGSTTPAFRNGVNPAGPVATRLAAAETAGYATLKAAHLADYHALFNRVTLDLGAPPATQGTPARLAAYKAGGADNHLESLLFQYGRYLLISSSRDSLPANLQGLWNNSNSPAWFADYHVNINLQMNYWMAETANLAECHLPLFAYLDAIAPLSRVATKASFGATTPGWTMRTSVNPFGGHGWEWDTPSSGWVARHYWEHYLHSGDTAFLQDRAWPVMKEVCEFWIHRLKERGDGKLVAPNGWSPEHGPVEDGVSYVQEIVWDLFTNTLAAEAVLDNDPSFRAVLQDRLSRLLVPAIGPHGQITEWANPATEAAYGYGRSDHRHTSHLYGVYPGFQFNPVDTPAYVAAGKLSLADRGTSGDSRTSWTWPWRTAMWARMAEPEKAHAMIRGLLTHNTHPNLFTYHPPFQIDGNLGFPAGVCEMLLQSHTDEIELPALPAAWPAGSFTGLRARGGFEVDAAWSGGTHSAVTVRSSHTGTVKLRLPENVTGPGAFVRSADGLRAVTKTNGLLVFPTVAGAAYVIDPAVSGNADDDDDGYGKEAEWLAGTDPEDGTSRPLLEIAFADGDGTLSWRQIAGRRYEIEYSPDLVEPWDVVETRDAAADGTATIPLPAAASPSGFYRLKITLLPD